MLEFLGYTVTVATNGQEALALMESGNFAAILMDCRMPVMGGHEATKILRQREETRKRNDCGHHQTIIALTAYASDADRELCMAAGMDDYLAKPYTLEQLSIMMDRWTASDDAADSPRFPAGSDAQEPAHHGKPCITTAADHDGNPDRADGIPTMDYRFIENIRKLDPDGQKRLLRTLIRNYLNNASGVISALHQAADDNDMEEMFRKAHYLKSGSANLGAARLAQLCKVLEYIGKNCQTLENREILASIESEFEAVSKELMALLPQEIP